MGTDSGGRGQERGLKIEKWGLGMVTGTREILCCPRPSPLVPDCPQLEIQRVFGLKLNRKILIVTGTRSSLLFDQSFDLTLVGPYRPYKGILL